MFNLFRLLRLVDTDAKSALSVDELVDTVATALSGLDVSQRLTAFETLMIFVGNGLQIRAIGFRRPNVRLI
jgi:hypothetical protein